MRSSVWLIYVCVCVCVCVCVWYTVGVAPPRSYVVEATEAVAGVAATDPATVEWVTRYFGAGDQWYFLDAEEKTQGPFTGEVMTSWFKVCRVPCPSIRCGERVSLRFVPAGGLLLER